MSEKCLILKEDYIVNNIIPVRKGFKIEEIDIVTRLNTESHNKDVLIKQSKYEKSEYIDWTLVDCSDVIYIPYDLFREENV
ncbi:MAG: hypothetical protein ISR65_19755 [Bacteriovoracaceae bacterium]|nr:hypothetical protein [Bacteriovoracaceae bacterium]